MNTLRLTLSCCLALCVLVIAASMATAQTQLNLPRASPKATVMQTVGTTDITITYGRPATKDRKIFGAAVTAPQAQTVAATDRPLVPYGEVWRTGANEATTIAFSDPVTINGQPLAAGRYSLHTIPGADSWTIIFNKVAEQWGSFQHDAKQDALRVQARPEAAPKREILTFNFPVLTDNSAVVALNWDTVRVPFTVGVEVNEKTLANARQAITAAKTDDWQTPFRAASFAFERNLAPDESLAWVEKSIVVRETYNNLALKASMMARRGNTAEARRLAERAIALGKAAKPQPANTSAMERLLTELNRKS